MEEIRTPGLKYRKRRGGVRVPYWIASPAAVKAGFRPSTVNLSSFADQPALLRQKCERLQSEVLMWQVDRGRRDLIFDGTFRTLIDRYLSDRDSPFHTLKPATKHPYLVYSKKLMAHVGSRRIDAIDGRDVRRWFAEWAGVADVRSPDARIPRARMVLCVLKAAISFGIVCRLPGCAEFRGILAELEFPTNKARKLAPTAEQIEAARRAAHAVGAPRRAFLYALQFETTLRQWDLLGQWVPLSDPRPSAILRKGEKWVGPTWAQIDQHLVLRLTPGKTADTTDTTGAFDLSACPMVMEELASISAEVRKGPLIINERTGLPYVYDAFKDAWRADFEAAGLPVKMWNRDLRAGGITEAGIAAADPEDRRKVAGHTTQRMNATIYDRDRLEAHRRVAKARSALRKHDE
jgi:hypothetical protein